MKVDILKNKSLKKFNTFAIDVKAKYFVDVKSVKELVELFTNELLKNKKCLILGGGSNLLFSEDFNGIVVKNSILGIDLIEETESNIVLKVGAGEIWDDFVDNCLQNNWFGLENLSLIPGTVGASPIQNIGAYGVEVKDSILKVEYFNIETKTIEYLNNKECLFAYRDSIFKHKLKGKAIVTNVFFSLSKSFSPKLSYGSITDYLESKNQPVSAVNLRNAIINIRRSKLPDETLIPNAGSFFKNPVVSKFDFERLQNEFDDLKYYKISDNQYKIPAGWMIEKAGLKGKVINGVSTYEKQALVIIKKEEVSGKEIINFSNLVKQKVFELFGINIETEVNIIN